MLNIWTPKTKVAHWKLVMISEKLNTTIMKCYWNHEISRAEGTGVK